MIPLGVADVKRAGEDITIVATSSMVYVALEAADMLAAMGISAEVVDPRTLVAARPRTLIASAKQTGRAIVVDEGHQSYGASAELAAVIADGAFHYLDAPVTRHRRDGRPDPVLAGARRPDRPDRRERVAAGRAPLPTA